MLIGIDGEKANPIMSLNFIYSFSKAGESPAIYASNHAVILPLTLQFVPDAGTN